MKSVKKTQAMFYNFVSMKMKTSYITATPTIQVNTYFAKISN